MSRRGSLLVVGAGLKAGGQLTCEARSAIENADKVFYRECNPLIVHQILSLNRNAETLTDLYARGTACTQTYAHMTDRIVAAVRQGLRVCAVFYGHPAIFAKSSHDSIRIARAEGHEAYMLAGVSAEDCLFADLGINPCVHGCQSYEATDFLLRRRPLDRRSTVVLWQAGVIGIVDYPDGQLEPNGVDLLVEVLLDTYPADHEAIIYEAAQFAVLTPRIERVAIQHLARAKMTAISTLVISPAPGWNDKSTIDRERARRLGLEDHLFGRDEPARDETEEPREQPAAMERHASA